MLRGIFGSGGGAPVGGSGTLNTIPRWTGATTSGDSIISQDTNARAIGIGVTPASTWDTAYRAIQLGQTASAMATSTAASNWWSQNNGVWDGTNWKYTAAGAGAQYAQIGGEHRFSYVASGSAGANFTWSRAVTIDTSGNFGIGTASPATRLHVLASADAHTTFASSSATRGYTEYRYNTSTILGYVGTASGLISGGASSDFAFRVESGNNIAFATGTTERARIDSSGNVILNTANTGATIQAAGTSQGLKLQGVSGTNNTDPNTLDCYADGGTANSGGVTWTPTVLFGGATTGITYTTQIGRYTRIGNMIFATATIVLSSKGSATGVATIGGLPAAVANLTGLQCPATVGDAEAIAFSGQIMLFTVASSQTLRVYQMTEAGVRTQLTDAAFANNSAITLFIAYPVT